MKKIMAAALTAAMLFTAAVPAFAATDTVDTLTEEMTEFQETVSFKSDNQNETLLEVFNNDPRLFYYFYKYDDEISPSGKKHNMTITYRNTETPIDAVFVVNNADDLYNVVGMALAETLTSVPIVITDSALTKDDIVDAIDQWKTDNYLVYMGYSGASAQTANAEISSWTSCTLELTYMEDGSTIQQWRTETEDKIVDICESLFALDMPSYQKELLIHDYIVQNCTYEESATDDSQYTAYGCLVNGKAVCEGYAEAANLLFQAAGLDSEYVEGAGSSADHAWNCVEIEGSWYWVDVTWDDPVPSEGGSETLSHNYFNLTDSQLNTDHSWQAAEYPSCTSTTWNYTAVNDAISEDTNTYSDYSSRNLVTVDETINKLEVALNVDADEVTAAETAAAENAAESAAAESAAVGTASAETAAETVSAETAASGHGHALRTVIIILVILILLVAAYMVYRRIMYLRMLERKRARRLAQQGRRPAQQSRRPVQREEEEYRRPAQQRSRPASEERPRSSSASRTSSRPEQKRNTRPEPQRDPRLNGAGKPRRENPFRH